MERRPYGNSGHHLSLIGFGGIVVAGMAQSDANRIVHEAIDRGINYFDVAPTYGDAEERLGPALEGHRDKIFLACKTTQRQKEGAARELRESLRKLRTDRFDLYQLHGLPNVAETEACFAPGGAMEAFLEARQAGLIRYIGFSAHSVEAALLALERFPFDSVLFPFNYTAYYQANFGPQVLEIAKQKNAARLALKAMARRPWPEGTERKFKNCWYEPHTNPADAELALRWTLSLPITAAIPPGDPGIFRMALDFAERFKPLSEEEQKAVQARANDNKPLFPLAA
ncbi:MAG TPA: aldo/keto reductase [Chthonomonadales bacterium]|nr:aldo/keto reductase [Chthonomonadales bacterium]